MADHNGSVIESQVDWLTVSAHGEGPARNMLDYAIHLGKEEEARGNRKKRWRLMGYDGSHIGRVEYGQRDNASTILRLIGQPAEDHLTEALSLADQVTRIDIAATYRADPPDPFLGRNSYYLAEQFHKANPRSALPSYHGDASGGYTCYIGKRESDYYFRLYNKEAECIALDDQDGAERYRAAWRYELEVKSGTAERLADEVDRQENRSGFIQRYLFQWCQAHGVEPAFGQFGGRALIPGFRRRSDADTKLRHLAKNVRPTVDYFREIGRLDDVIRTLGLS